MQLIGMLDSPYVRRAAISLRCMGLAFEHRSLSVFSHFEPFRAINPVVKAPSLVCDDGTVLMDSTLILDYAAALPGARSLLPAGIAARQQALRVIGLALAACEKGVQTVYERQLRPPEKQHAPWLARVRGQLAAACDEWERELQRAPLDTRAGSIDQAGITSAVVWSFLQTMVAELVPAADYPALTRHAAAAEQLAEFLAFPPDGPGVPAGAA
jgi:glutathione S-transferase